jgi:hypothetical protein
VAADNLQGRISKALEESARRYRPLISARDFESLINNDLLHRRAAELLDDRKFNPQQLRDPRTGKWMRGLATGTRMVDLSPKGKVAVAANDAKYGVTRKALEAELESKLTAAGLMKAKHWYPDARTFNEGLAKRSGLSVEQATAITAAVSPRTPWPRNRRLAERVALTHKQYTDADPRAAARRMGGGLSLNLGAGVAIARGGSIDAHLTGAKRRSFYNNMLLPGRTDDVTVDTWMQRMAMTVAGKPMSLDDSVDYLTNARAATDGVGAGYVSIAEAVRAVAARRGVSPDEVQAAYWIAVAGGEQGGHPGKG